MVRGFFALSQPEKPANLSWNLLFFCRTKQICRTFGGHGPLDPRVLTGWCCIQRCYDESCRSAVTCSVAGLTTGDVYITRHSNLSQVHVIFHLVSDDSVSGTGSDLTSRHPIIVACRNILKICFRYDVRHITLPLLLVHEMTEVSRHAWVCGRLCMTNTSSMRYSFH